MKQTNTQLKKNNSNEYFDVTVIGGGPAGSTAANELALKGIKVLLLDKAGRIKPCGGAIPPRAIKDYEIPDKLLVAKAKCARMISPKEKKVDMPIDNGFVGMVDREEFDEWLRERASSNGAVRKIGSFESVERFNGDLFVNFEERESISSVNTKKNRIKTKFIIGADGAHSKVGRQEISGAKLTKFVFAYHEIVKVPESNLNQEYDPSRCDVVYSGKYSPDFYSWIFPHGKTMSIGTGSADKGFSLRNSVQRLRNKIGMEHYQTIRCEGAPIPLKPLKKWDNGKDVILAGDAAGVVAPSSGEGIYYAMLGGELAAEATSLALTENNAQALSLARKKFMKLHGKVFWILGVMQWFWYKNDRLRERFVDICKDQDVQQITFDSYMNKELVKKKKTAHIKIFFKDLAHLLGIAKV